MCADGKGKGTACMGMPSLMSVFNFCITIQELIDYVSEIGLM